MAKQGPRPLPGSRHGAGHRAGSTPTAPRAESTPAARHAGGDEEAADRQLARLLDTPHLATLVPALPPETLHALIQRRGLEDCAELVTAATPQQLMAVLDVDLWQPARGGRDDRFDVDRFAEWLEVLLEMDETAAARTIAAIDADLVIAGLSRYLGVFDPATLATPQGDDEPGDERGSSSGQARELGGYVLRALRADAWDAIVTLLAALEESNRAYFDAVMQGCRRLSNSAPEIDGLDELLAAPEQLLHDVAAEREQRRAHLGYATAADARAFLQMARKHRDRSPESTSTNPLAAAYFRAADVRDESAPPGARAVDPPAALPPADAAESAWVGEVAALLAGAEIPAVRPRALLEGAVEQPPRLAPFQHLMERVRDVDADVFARRSAELAFLVNTLIAGCSVQSRALTPAEAADAAAATCNLGLQHWRVRRPQGPTGGSVDRGHAAALPDTFLVDHDLVAAFEVGWAVLHDQVSMFVAERLAAMLEDLQCADPDVQDGLHALRRELLRQCADGTPWQAAAELEAIAMLDLPVWAGLRGLLDECPVLPAAVTATLERRAGGVSATAFDFIATASQIREVHVFADQLLDALMR